MSTAQMSFFKENKKINALLYVRQILNENTGYIHNRGFRYLVDTLRDFEQDALSLNLTLEDYLLTHRNQLLQYLSDNALNSDGICLIVKVLFDLGANPHLTNARGQPVSVRLIEIGSIRMVKLLEQYGAKPGEKVINLLFEKLKPDPRYPYAQLAIDIKRNIIVALNYLVPNNLSPASPKPGAM